MSEHDDLPAIIKQANRLRKKLAGDHDFMAKIAGVETNYRLDNVPDRFYMKCKKTMLLSNLKVDGEKQQSRIKERGWLDNKHGSGDANSDAADTAADKPSSYSHSAATPRFLTGSFSDMFRKLHLKNSNEHLYENRKANRRIQFTNPVNFRVDHSDTALTTDDQSIVSIYSTPNRSTSSPSSSLSTPVPYSSQLLQQYQRSKSKADLKRIRNNSIAADSPYAADKRVQRRVHDWVNGLSEEEFGYEFRASGQWIEKLMDALSMLSNEEENKNDETDNTNNNTDKKNGSEKDHHLRIFLDDISRNTEKRNSSEGNEKVNAKFKQYEGGRLRYPDDRVVAKCCDLLVELIHSVPGRLASSMKPMVAHLLAAIYADCNGRGVMSSVMTLHNSHNQPTQDDPYMDNLDANTDKDKHIGSMYYQKHNSRAENKRKRRKKKTVKRLMNRIGDSHFSIVRKTESKVNRYNKGLAIIDALMNHFEQAQQAAVLVFKRAVEERVFTIKATVFIKWRTHVNTIKAQRAAMMKIVDKVGRRSLFKRGHKLPEIFKGWKLSNLLDHYEKEKTELQLLESHHNALETEFSKTTELVDEYKKNLQAHRIDLITRKQSFKNLELKQQAIQKLNRVNNDTNIIPILETCMTMLQHGLDDLRNEVAEHLFVHDFDDFDQEQQLQAGTTTEDETEVRSQKKGTTSGAESSTAPQPPKRRRRRKSKFIRRKKKKPKLVNDPRLMVEGIISPHEKGAMLKGMEEERLLLFWFNYQLKQTKCRRKVQNFSFDLQDSECLSNLLSRVYPNLPIFSRSSSSSSQTDYMAAFTMNADLEKRASKLLQALNDDDQHTSSSASPSSSLSSSYSSQSSSSPPFLSSSDALSAKTGFQLSPSSLSPSPAAAAFTSPSPFDDNNTKISSNINIDCDTNNDNINDDNQNHKYDSNRHSASDDQHGNPVSALRRSKSYEIHRYITPSDIVSSSAPDLLAAWVAGLFVENFCVPSQLEAKTREVLLRIKKLSIECQNLRHSLHGMVSVEYFMQVIRSFTSLCDDTMHLVAYARQGTALERLLKDRVKSFMMQLLIQRFRGKPKEMINFRNERTRYLAYSQINVETLLDLFRYQRHPSQQLMHMRKYVASRYSALSRIYQYYAQGTYQDEVVMTSFEFWLFVDDCGLLHPPVHMTKDPFKPSKVIYYHAMQQILHRTSILASLNQHSGIAAGTSSHSRSHTSNPAGKDDIGGHENDNIHCIEGAGDRENILTEAKFIEAIVRIANLRFQMHDSLCDRFEAFCDEEVLQRAKQLDINGFSTSLRSFEVLDIYKSNRVLLRKMFLYYATRQTVVKKTQDKAFNKIVKWTNTIDFDEFMDLIEDCHLLVLSESRHMYGSGCLTRDDCRTIFVNVQLHQQHDGSEDSRIESNVLQRKRSILSKLTKRAQRQSKVRYARQRLLYKERGGMSSSGLRGANRAVSGMGSDLYGNHSLGGGSNSSGMHYLANSSGVRDGAAPIQNGMRRASMGVGRGTAIGMYVNSLLNPSSQQFPSAKDIGENGINDDDNDCVLSAIKGRNIKVSANDVMNPMMRHRRRRSSLGHVSRHDLMPVVMQTISVARQEHNHRDYVSLAAANGKSDGGSEQNSDEGGHLTAQAAAGDLISVSPQHRQRLLFDAFAVTSPLGSPQLAHSARRLKGRRNSLAGALPSYFSKNISSGLRASSEGMDRGSSESLYAELRAAMLGNGGNEGIDRGESMNKDLSSSNVDGGRARTRKLESRSKTKGTSAGIDRNGDGSSDAADNQKGQAKGRIKRKKDQWKVHTLYTLPSLHSDEKKKDDDSVVAQSELIYPEFLEALTCLAVWKYPDPYFRISHRLEHFLVADVFPAFRGAVEQQKEAQKTK